VSEQPQEAPIEQHPDYEPVPAMFDADDDEPGDEDSAPIPAEDDDSDG
jgi:hypothetical protein